MKTKHTHLPSEPKPEALSDAFYESLLARGDGHTGRRRCPRPGVSENAELNRLRAYEMRIRGLTFRRISEDLGVSLETAYRYVGEAAQELADMHPTDGFGALDPIESARQTDIAQLDELEAVWLQLALSEALRVQKDQKKPKKTKRPKKSASTQKSPASSQGTESATVSASETEPEAEDEIEYLDPLDCMLKAANAVLKIKAFKAKLLRLDQPPAPACKHMTLDEWDQRMRDADV